MGFEDESRFQSPFSEVLLYFLQTNAYSQILPIVNLVQHKCSFFKRKVQQISWELQCNGAKGVLMKLHQRGWEDWEVGERWLRGGAKRNCKGR